MRAVNLAKIAAEAEILRIQHMLKRQGMRAAFGLVAVLFALGVLVLAHVAGWQGEDHGHKPLDRFTAPLQRAAA